MKNEIVNIYRFEQSNGKDRFDLAPDKANKLNDDRAYCFAMLGYQLSLLHRDGVLNKKKPKSQNIQDKLPIRTPTRRSGI